MSFQKAWKMLGDLLAGTGAGQQALLLMVLGLAVRFFGLLRARIYAGYFGAGTELDTYYAAFRIPDLFMGIFIISTLSLAVIPVISGLAKRHPYKAKQLVAVLLNWTALVMLVASSAVVFLSPWLAHLVAPGFPPGQLADLITLTRLVMIAQIFLALANLLSSSLNAVKRFVLAGLAPLFYNFGLIAGVLWFYPFFGLPGLGLGVIMGALGHMLVVAIDFFRCGFYLDFSAWRASRDIREVARLYVPRLFNLDLSQIGLLVSSILGSFLQAGSIAVFALGFDIQALPIGILAFAVAGACFPYLSESFSKGDEPVFAQYLEDAIRRILFFMVPISAMLLLLRAHLVRLLYGAGQFSWSNTRSTLVVVGVLAFSVIGQSLVPLLSRAFLARRHSWPPVLTNISCMLVLVAMAGFTVRPWGIAGVAFGYALAIDLDCAILYMLLRRQMPKVSVRPMEHRLMLQTWKILAATSMFAIVLYTALYLFAPLVNTHTWLGIFCQASLSTLIAGVVYLALAARLSLPEARTILGAMKQFKLD